MDDVSNKLTVGVLLFDGFAVMDACGPMQFFDFMNNEFSLVTVGKSAGIKYTAPPLGGVPIKATYSFETCPLLDVLLIPGGKGCRKLFHDSMYQDFILKHAKSVKYLMSVCTGSGFLAECGLLDGKRATTNKKAFHEIVSSCGTQYNINWVVQARWVVDGNIWTSSGVTAGMDMTYSFLVHLYGSEYMKQVIQNLEYTPAIDSNQDPFSYLAQ